MTARLSSQHYPRDRNLSGWWHCLPAAPVLPKLEDNISADVVIVGAGFAGLSAAKRLHENNAYLKVVVLDAQGLAWAASGRNSGFMIDLPHELNSNNYAGAQQYDLDQIDENRAAISFAESVVDEFGLHAYFSKPGKYHGATNGAGIKALTEFAKHLDALREPYDRLTSEDLKQITGSHYYDGGIYTPGAALIQPAGYIQGLGLALNREAKINIYEHSSAHSIESTQGGVVVKTERGQVSAGQAILANNGHIESFGVARGKILHLFTYASLTEELGHKQLAKLGEPESWGLIPASPMGTTLRRLDNGRLLVRNRWTYQPDITTSEAAMTRYGKEHDHCFARRYPNLQNVNMQYRWSGAVAMTLNSQSVFGEVQPNVYAAAVCQGLGTTRSTLMGLLLADKLCGKSSAMLQSMEASPGPSTMPPRLLNNIGVPAYLKWVHWRAGSDL